MSEKFLNEADMATPPDTHKIFEHLKGDKLDKIFYLQKLFDSDVEKNRNLNFTKEEWLQRQTLAMVSELAELLDEVNFKWWKNVKPVDDDALRNELVDILHFFVGMCLRSGMDSDELFERYLKKNAENFDRQYGKSSKKGYELF